MNDNYESIIYSIGEAKTNLINALRDAEYKGIQKSFIKKIEKLCADAESLQAKMREKSNRSK